MFFADNERQLLKSLKTNPVWESILNKISQFSSTPRYRPDKTEKQVSDWMYQSGRLDERESIISLLRLLNVKVKLEKELK